MRENRGEYIYLLSRRGGKEKVRVLEIIDEDSEYYYVTILDFANNLLHLAYSKLEWVLDEDTIKDFEDIKIVEERG